MENGYVTLECSDHNSVGRGSHQSPERDSRQPYATNELIIDAVTWHTSAIHFDNSDQQHDEWRAHVYRALIDNHNVYRLNKHKTGNLTVSSFQAQYLKTEFHCIAFYCWTGQLRCKSSLSDIIIIIIIN